MVKDLKNVTDVIKKLQNKEHLIVIFVTHMKERNLYGQFVKLNLCQEKMLRFTIRIYIKVSGFREMSAITMLLQLKV